MNQLDLILENIRLSHIERLLQEANSQAEVDRGVALINESMSVVAGLLEEAVHANHPNLNKANAGMVPGLIDTTVPVVSKTLGKTINVPTQVQGFVPNEILQNRNELANEIRNLRGKTYQMGLREKIGKRDIGADNMARLASQTGIKPTGFNYEDMMRNSSLAPFYKNDVFGMDGSMRSIPRVVPITNAGIASQNQEAQHLGFK